MAGATLIATVFAVILLIIAGYVLVAGVLKVNEVVVAAQKDITDREVKLIHTSIRINSTSYEGGIFTVTIENSGNEPINNLTYLDLYLYDSSTQPKLYTYLQDLSTTDHWSRGDLYYLDKSGIVKFLTGNHVEEGMYLNMSVRTGTSPTNVKVVTENGIAASKRLI